jgi:phosphoglycolate phosphatase
LKQTKFPIPVKAIAIDLDGTMLDTVEDLAIAINQTLAELGAPTLDLALPTW